MNPEENCLVLEYLCIFNTYAVIDMPNLKDYNLNTNKLENLINGF